MKKKCIIILIISVFLNLIQIYAYFNKGSLTTGTWKVISETEFHNVDLLAFVDSGVNCEYAYSVDFDGTIFLNHIKVGHVEWFFFGRIKIVDNDGKVYYYKQI